MLLRTGYKKKPTFLVGFPQCYKFTTPSSATILPQFGHPIIIKLGFSPIGIRSVSSTMKTQLQYGQVKMSPSRIMRSLLSILCVVLRKLTCVCGLCHFRLCLHVAI